MSSYDTFSDYMDMSMQMGYVLLFSIAWPLSALCASVNNILEIRSDLFKVTLGRRYYLYSSYPNMLCKASNVTLIGGLCPAWWST